MSKTMPLAVIAVGGNALISDSDHKSIEDQSNAAEAASRHIADIAENGWNVIVVHGNGPQVGFILRRSEMAMAEVPEISMGYADANTQGVIGFMFQRALYNEFHRRKNRRGAIAVVTQVLVDQKDPAFDQPTKPIGSHMDEVTSRRCGAEQGWVVREEPGRGWRRVVSSPQPRKIIELGAIKSLIADEFIVIACGGGGIPVVEDSDGALRGVEAVIDKDLTSSLLAQALGAEMLIIATEIDRVALNFDGPDLEWLSEMTVSEAKRYCDEGQFPEGSMGPKIRSLIAFVQFGQGRGLVTNVANLRLAFDGKAGTLVVPDIPARGGGTRQGHMLQ
jgi:carbamate kinase